MRIIHWYPNFLTGGGVANAVLGMATAEARLGAEVIIAASESFGPALYEPMREQPNVALHVWKPAWPLRVGGTQLRFIPSKEVHLLRSFRPDLVHVHGGFILDNLRAPRLFTCPLVFSPHSALHPVIFKKSRRLMKRLYLNVEKRIVHRHVSAYHALSPLEGKQLARLFPRKEIYCVPNGPNIQLQNTQITGDRNVDSPEGTIRFLFIGRLAVFHKGLDILLDAYAEAIRRMEGQRSSLILVGPDWQGGRLWLEQRAQALGITDRVVFTGSLSSREVSRYLSQADVYVQISRYEGFPLSVAEALLAGKPVIISDAGGVASFVELATLPHVRVVPTNFEEAASAILSFARRLEELTAAAKSSRKKVCSFFSWDRIGKVHLQHYGSI